MSGKRVRERLNPRIMRTSAQSSSSGYRAMITFLKTAGALLHGVTPMLLLGRPRMLSSVQLRPAHKM